MTAKRQTYDSCETNVWQLQDKPIIATNDTYRVSTSLLPAEGEVISERLMEFAVKIESENEKKKPLKANKQREANLTFQLVQ